MTIEEIDSIEKLERLGVYLRLSMGIKLFHVRHPGDVTNSIYF
jgi:hypothetical protein